jgi:hypothetical protein
MTTSQPETCRGNHYTAVQLGTWEQLTQYSVEVPALPGRKIPGKLFLKELMGLSSMEISVNKLPAGASVPFYHTHKEHEEVYLFIRGKDNFWGMAMLSKFAKVLSLASNLRASVHIAITQMKIFITW